MSEPTTTTPPEAPPQPQSLRITGEHVRDGQYVGPDVSNWAGSIEIAARLGWVAFRGSIRASGSIRIEAGSGIKAGWGIKAGSGIEAGEGIKAGWGIEAGEGIEAGSGIEAGWGIKAGFSIICKWIKVRLRIFAGLCVWRLPKAGENEVRGELRGGAVSCGTLVPPPVPAAEGDQ